MTWNLTDDADHVSKSQHPSHFHCQSGCTGSTFYRSNNWYCTSFRIQCVSCSPSLSVPFISTMILNLAGRDLNDHFEPSQQPKKNRPGHQGEIVLRCFGL